MKVELKYSDTTKCKEEKEQNVDDLKIIVKEESKDIVGGCIFYCYKDLIIPPPSRRLTKKCASVNLESE